MGDEITREDIDHAWKRIRRHIRRTPVAELGRVDDLRYRLLLKLDSMQPSGSFKVRGAFSALTATPMSGAGVVAASGGNFALAVAYAANTLGLKATVFVPDTSPEEKIDRISAYGAEVRVVPGYYAQALERSREWAAASGATEVHAYDQPLVVAGQGTCGREIMEQVPEVATIVVAVGGGGLIGGIASWVRTGARVVGVEPERCPTLHQARVAGRPVDVEVGGVTSSALGATRIGDIAWGANGWIHSSLLVSEDVILEARRWLWDRCRVLAEPAACAPIAALLTGAFIPEPGESVVVVVSGANTSTEAQP